MNSQMLQITSKHNVDCVSYGKYGQHFPLHNMSLQEEKL